MNEFYTYAYLRKDKTPYYIGKGKEDRIYSKQKNINLPRDKSRIIYLKQNLTEEEAFKHEIYMIAVFGRKDNGTGILRNKTDGGEGASGAIRGDEFRRKISETLKGHVVLEETRRKICEAQKGKTHSEETKRKMSEAQKGKTSWNKGKTHSEQTRKKISETLKGKTHSEETKKRMSFTGKTHSEETKKRMSEAHKNPSEEIRRKISDANKDKKWWNDGCGNRKRMLECPGDGWRLGRK